MSVASEIGRIQGAKASLKTSIEAKGVTVPSTTKIDGYASLVDQISASRFPDMDKDTTLPAGYTRLYGLRKCSQTAFINTGIYADSTTGFDIVFSIEPQTGTNGASVFGIRRASGNTDTEKIGLYCNPSSYFSGFAVIYGSSDSGTISGAGNGCAFGGNIVKVSLRGGKWYVWDRLIYDGSGDTFSNSDNTPFVIGNLAKNSSPSMYGNSAFLTVFLSAKFYNGNNELIKDLVPVMFEGSLGMYDKVNENFLPVNSSTAWTPEVISDRIYRSARLIGQMRKIQDWGGCQSAVYYNGWTVCVKDNQQDFVLSNDVLELKNGTMSQTGVVLKCSEYVSNWHGNACWFGSEKYNPNDIFPILYVSTDRQNCTLVAYRISGSSIQDFAISIVQKIYTPVGDSDFQPTLYGHNYYGRAGCNTFLEISSVLSDYSISSGNSLRYREFPLPALSAGEEVTLTESDAIKKGELPYIYAGQNGGWNGTYFHISSADNVLYIFKITSQGADMVRMLNYSNGTFNPDLLVPASSESEGFSWIPEEECLLLLTEPTYGNVFKVYAEDLEQYM